MSFDLKGYRVLVTASTRGIGRGIAEVFLEEGAVVVINGRDKKRVDEAVRELRELGEVYGVAADLRVAEQVESLVKQAVEYMGGLDVVAYVTGPPKTGTFESLSLEDWEDSIKLLVKSAIWLTYYSLPHLKKSPHPSMIFATSTAVREPIENLVLTNVLRLSVHGLIKSLARELGKYGIRVNGVMPGYIRTDGLARMIVEEAESTHRSSSDIRKEMEERIPLRRFGEPKEVGYVVAFLASKYASYINGASIPVDGGMLSSIF